MKYIKSFILGVTFLFSGSLYAQTIDADTIKVEKEQKNRKAWEFGFGGSVAQLNRVYLSNFYRKESGGYGFDLDMKHALWGGDLFVARQLNRHFYIDLVAGMGGAKVQNIEGNKKTKFYYTGGLGLQWRLSPLLKSKYVEPYFRLGAQFTHRDFLVDYEGLSTIEDDEIRWKMTNNYNREGHDVRNLFSIVGGFGVNIWFNDHVGMGAIANYMYRPGFITKQKNVADAIQGSVRLMFRFGGESKREIPQMVTVPTYIDKVVEVPVERVVTIEREKIVFAMLQKVFF